MSDKIQFALLLLTAVGLFLNLWQNRTANRQKSAEYLIDLIKHYSGDIDTLKARYAIEYGQFEYRGDFHNSDPEKEIDKLLDLYDMIARLYDSSHLRLKDLKFLAYDFIVVCEDNEIKKYFEVLDNWYVEFGLKTKPFESLRGVSSKLADKYYNKNEVPHADWDRSPLLRFGRSPHKSGQSSTSTLERATPASTTRRSSPNT